MNSTRDLIAAIPPYMVGIISARIFGSACDSDTLEQRFNDTKHLQEIVQGLSTEEHSFLVDLYILGGQMEWQDITNIYGSGISAVREMLDHLGSLGLIFQGGLSGRDPIILLPSLMSVIKNDLKTKNVPKASQSWSDIPTLSITGHILMLNVLKSNKIRSKPGLEPFKKGWEALNECLSPFVNTKQVFSELEALGCITEMGGVVEVLQGPALSLAMEGELRYRAWRFLQSCKAYQGLDAKVYGALGIEGLSRDLLERTILLHLVHHFPELNDYEGIAKRLPALWIELGVLQTDESAHWVRLPEDVREMLDGAEIKNHLHAYKDEVIIQPNMEILVATDFDPVDHLNIGELADLQHADVVSIYRISRSSIYRAVRDGWNAARISNFLDRISRHAIPENVLKTISGWVVTLSQAHIIKGTFLVIENGQDKIPHGLEEVLPGIYRIPEKCEEEVSSYLDKKSVIVQRPEAHPHPEEDETAWNSSLPMRKHIPEQGKGVQKDGIYPFGMVMPLPYGHKAIEIFEQAVANSSRLVIFYPRHGYGEVQVCRVSPIYLFTRGGVTFVEAMNEESGGAEVFEIGKIRALLRAA